MVGKGDSMPKRKRNKKKYNQTDTEILLSGLHEIVRSGSEKAGTASSLISWFMTNQSWSDKQRNFAKALVFEKDMAKRKQRRTVTKYYLYAISDGRAVKIGFSMNVRRRLQEMQTGHPDKMVLLWKYLVGPTSAIAAQQEKKLHRFCKKYAIRGEWFTPECMLLVEQFAVKSKIVDQIEQEEHDAAMVVASQVYI